MKFCVVENFRQTEKSAPFCLWREKGKGKSEMKYTKDNEMPGTE